MSKIDVIRAWKDPEYRSSLSDSQRAKLPENPAGSMSLADSDLDSVVGGYTFFAGCQPLTDGFGGCPVSFPGICTCIDICPYTSPGLLCPEPIMTPPILI